MDTAPTASTQAVDDLTVYRSLFAAYPDALLLVDAAGSVVLANPAATALLGYATDELVGLSVDELVPDSIRPRHASYRHAYAHAPRSRPMGTQMELVAKRRDGSEVMVEIALSPLQDHGLPFVVAAIRDIGGYPRVKQALQRARYSEHLAQLGRLAADGRDPQLLLQQVPTIAAEALEVEMALVLLLERNRLELRVAGGVGLIAGEALGAIVPNRGDTPLGFVLAQGQPVVVEDFRAEPRFAIPPAYLEAGLVSALAVPLQDRGRVIGALKVRSRQPKRFGDDEQRFLQALASLLATCLQRAQSEEALNHAQRLESVGQLTGGIAHDFNNLLTVIQGNLQVLEELPLLAGEEFAQQLVGAATRASKRGAELTSKLLAFSRRQVLQPDAVDVGAMLLSLADMLRRTLDQRIAIEVDIAQGCPSVLADPGQLESALLNIAINARDAMPDGGSLRFSAGLAGSLPADVRREIDDASAQDERFVRIAISDTGSGMPEEVKERAFEPFFTTKQAGRGTGLGLSTVYGFVKQSRGAVSIDSTPGFGTTISLYLPRPWDDQPTGDEAGPAADAVPPGLKVLMVEDDAEVRSVARRFLDTLGCEVTVCASAEQALLLLTPDARFELLLTDIALGPGMRGTELARLAQERLPQLSILLMSGFSAELLDADRDSPPGWELLPKPYSRSELAQAIARALAA
ncbi:PAS domain S-box-containing protein [Pelomonas saccharophila]|uniref:histidine kinase n=1 Tax=Roseateles saccharophilus TaxID=304 RepID=A0ABU1YN23_ROSSA|nr:PAS domain S-box protein [Roseateles saccharophilus]MDR7270256.1 PAS domain S-box-containing protein [Roseateles saccharophilus]